jgi:hypothetical protein
VVSTTPGRFTPGKDTAPIVQEAGWSPDIWTCAKNLAPTGIRSPDRSDRIQSLYRLNYAAHCPVGLLSETDSLPLFTITPLTHFFLVFCPSFLRAVIRRPCLQSDGNTICPIKPHDYTVFRASCFCTLIAQKLQFAVPPQISLSPAMTRNRSERLNSATHIVDTSTSTFSFRFSTTRRKLVKGMASPYYVLGGRGGAVG